MKKVLFVGLFATFAVLGASCGGDAEETLTTSNDVVSENPYGGVEVPPPAPNEPILKLVKGGEVISLSLNDLRKFPTVKVTVFEPFVKQEITFVGVAMEELFRAVGIELADEVLTIALNEYTYSNFAKEFVGTDAFIAYEQGGVSIPMNRGGPLRIIVPNNRPLTESLEVWNWSLAEIRAG